MLIISLEQGDTLSPKSENNHSHHYRKLKEQNLNWTIPQKIDETASELQGLDFPSLESLWDAFNDGEGGYHLVFLFRSSEAKGITSIFEDRMRYVKRIVEMLRRTGRISGHVSTVMIIAEFTKAKLMPSFFGDIALEATLIAVEPPEMDYDTSMTKRPKTSAKMAAATTVQLTTHILYAILHSKHSSRLCKARCRRFCHKTLVLPQMLLRVRPTSARRKDLPP